MLLLYTTTTVQDSTRWAGNGYYPIWCTTQMRSYAFPQSTAPTLHKGRFCCAETCRPALLRESEALNGRYAYRSPWHCLRPGVWAAEAAERAAEASHEARSDPRSWARDIALCGRPGAMRSGRSEQAHECCVTVARGHSTVNGLRLR
jgi:hypothetical protein